MPKSSISPVVDLSMSKKEEAQIKLETIRDTIRDDVQDYAKNFKTSWLKLGQHLYAIHQDKMFHAWGFEKFEDYLEEELGIKKSIGYALFKAYIFIEEQEPMYLEENFNRQRPAAQIPSYDGINVLRLAKGKKELLARDYQRLRNRIFEKGADASAVRKDLTALMKERKIVDPEEERERRQTSTIKKFIHAINAFKKEAQVLQIVPDSILAQIMELKKNLEAQT